MSWAGPAEFKQRVRELEPYEFEQFVAELWELQGWNTRVTQQSQDRGIDIIAKRNDPVQTTYYIQAKRHAEGNVVGSPDVQQYSSLLVENPNIAGVIIVTSSGFSKQAQELARGMNVELIDGDELYELADSVGLTEIPSKFQSETIDFGQYGSGTGIRSTSDSASSSIEGINSGGAKMGFLFGKMVAKLDTSILSNDHISDAINYFVTRAERIVVVVLCVIGSLQLANMNAIGSGAPYMVAVFGLLWIIAK